MKVLRICFSLLICLFIFSGCVNNNKDALKDFSKKMESLESYHLNGVLEINNDENSYLYDVDVSYLKENNFKVSLKNQTNNHEQIILRNSDGVFVLTPSLNKSFKFQSDWPFNSSQSYLLHNLLNDINNDSSHVITTNESGSVIKTTVNYSNNKDFVYQNIYFDKNNDIYMVEVFDSSDVVKIKMIINSIDYNKSFNSDDFKLENNMSVSNELDESVSKIDDITYPMYIPKNTYLSSQDTVSKENGERVILTFAGDYPFMLIQETVSLGDSDIVSVNGEPLQLVDCVGIIDDSSITWVNNGIEYYLVSSTMNSDELIDVANSLTVASIQK